MEYVFAAFIILTAIVCHVVAANYAYKFFLALRFGLMSQWTDSIGPLEIVGITFSFFFSLPFFIGVVAFGFIRAYSDCARSVLISLRSPLRALRNAVRNLFAPKAAPRTHTKQRAAAQRVLLPAPK